MVYSAECISDISLGGTKTRCFEDEICYSSANHVLSWNLPCWSSVTHKQAFIVFEKTICLWGEGWLQISGEARIVIFPYVGVIGFVSCLMWMLEIKLQSSARSIHAINHWDISPTHQPNLLAIIMKSRIMLEQALAGSSSGVPKPTSQHTRVLEYFFLRVIGMRSPFLLADPWVFQRPYGCS